MRATLQHMRMVFLASIMCIWQYRAVLLLPGLAVVAIDLVTEQQQSRLFILVLQFLSIGLSVSVFILIHRAILLDDKRLNLNWSMREGKYVLALLGIFLVGFFAWMLLQYTSLNLMTRLFLPAEYPAPESLRVAEYDAPQALKDKLSNLFIASGVIGLAGLALVFSRLSMLLPMIAVDQNLDLQQALQRSRANQSSMFWLIYLPLVLFLPLALLMPQQLLAPVVLLIAFALQVFIFTSITIAYHLFAEDTA